MRASVVLIAMALLFKAGSCFGQGHVRDTTVAMVILSPSYAHQFPGGDLATRFEDNSNVGFGAMRKTDRNLLFGLEGSFIFGNNVVEPGILRNVINSAGQVVDQDGAMADVFLYERGWTAFATVGKIFPLFGPNPNSGLMVKLGGGYMRHKVRVQTQQNVVPQLEDEYLEGYDRLCGGPAALAFVGYQHFGNKRRLNFFAGVELMAGFTQALHPYNFDTEQYNTPERTDLLTGLRIGWSFPIYRRLDDRFRY